MKTEISSNFELTEATETRGLTLRRVRYEEAIDDNDEMPGMDYPAGFAIGD